MQEWFETRTASRHSPLSYLGEGPLGRESENPSRPLPAVRELRGRGGPGFQPWTVCQVCQGRGGKRVCELRQIPESGISRAVWRRSSRLACRGSGRRPARSCSAGGCRRHRTQIIQIPAIPIILIERSIPFGNLLLFLAIFIGLVRNTKISYFLRFNALQSLLINIGIIIVNFIFEIIFSPFLNSLIIRTFSSTLLFSLFAVIVYCVWSCTQGNEPDLPIISEATKMQL